jgi:hypothetical protein
MASRGAREGNNALTKVRHDISHSILHDKVIAFVLFNRLGQANDYH